MFRHLSDVCVFIRHKLKETTADNIIWWLNVTPRCAGFSIETHDNSVLFWTAHFVTLCYMTFLSNSVYRIKLAEDLEDIVKANTNMSIVLFTVNSSIWFLTKRSLLVSTIRKLREVDKLTSEINFLAKKHKKQLKIIKILVLIYYMVNICDVFCVWIPQRMDLSSVFYTSSPCPGIDVSIGINKYFCRGIILLQDVSISFVLINFQNVLLFLIAHTSLMFHLLAEEMSALQRSKDTNFARFNVKKKLSSLIKRHGLLLDMVQRLRSLYNMPIGVNFGTNAFCICLFFSLSLDAWVLFAPLILYCFLVFFLYCYICQKLIDSSIVFESSIYSCGWENYSISDKKVIYIVLKQAQKPVLLSAANMVPVNILTFATGMQFIYKFVTALKV